MAGTARPTRRELLGEIWDVVTDLPILLTAPLYRRWHLHWGATPAEIAEVLPGDALVPDAQFKATRATSIDALPEAVWPWLVQVGCLRAGFYSNDLLDNLAHPSATTIATADVTPREPHPTANPRRLCLPLSDGSPPAHFMPRTRAGSVPPSAWAGRSNVIGLRRSRIANTQK